MKLQVRGLALKLFISHLGLVLLLLLIGSPYLLTTTQQAYLHTLGNSLTDQAVVISQAVAPTLASGPSADVQRYLAPLDRKLGTRVLVADSSGRIAGATEAEQQSMLGQTVTVGGLDQALTGATVERVSPDASDLVYVAVPALQDGRVVGAVRVSYGLTELREELDGLLNSIRLTIMLAAVLSALLSVMLAYGLSRPARQLAEAAQALAAGDFSRRTGVRGSDEIGRAATSFDLMADELARMQTEREQLLGNVSHEIHSTITGMSMAVEMLQQSERLEARSRRLLLSGLHTHTQRLRRLADDLLESARIARGRLSLKMAELAAEDLVNDTVAIFTAEAADRGVRLTGSLQAPGLLLRGDRDRLGQAVGNLVENAIRHTPSGRSVVVTAEQRGGYCVFSVRDEGPGIQGAPVRTPFRVRGNLPGESTGRLGLGLGIVIAMAEAHHGWLEVETSPSEGSTFSMFVPVPPAGDRGAPASPSVTPAAPFPATANASAPMPAPANRSL